MEREEKPHEVRRLEAETIRLQNLLIERYKEIEELKKQNKKLQDRDDYLCRQLDEARESDCRKDQVLVRFVEFVGDAWFNR